MAGYDNDVSSQLTDIFGLVMLSSILAIPLVGLVIEYFEYTTITYAIIAFSVLWSTLSLVQSTSTAIYAFIFFGMYRAFLQSFTYAFVHDVSGNSYSGIMFGCVMFVSGFIGLSQYPLAKWAKGSCFDVNDSQEVCYEGHWTSAYMLIVFLVVMSSPFVLAIKDVQKKHLESSTSAEVVDRKSYGSVSVQE